MTEIRTWTLGVAPSGCDGEMFCVRAQCDEPAGDFGEVEVVELGPVLDLLEGLVRELARVRNLPLAPMQIEKTCSCPWCQTRRLLREHGRLNG